MRAVTLYRRILRVHRVVLPPDLRFLGDGYVKEEFRKHRDAEASYQEPFYRAWEEYTNTLIDQATNLRGKDLDPKQVNSLSDAQLKQLSLLRRESTRPLKGRE